MPIRSKVTLGRSGFFLNLNTTHNIAQFSAKNLNFHYTSPSFDATVPSLSGFLNNLGEEEGEGRFSFSPTTANEIERTVRQSTSQTMGAGHLTQRFMAAVLPSILQTLCYIFNKSLSAATFLAGELRSTNHLSAWRPP